MSGAYVAKPAVTTNPDVPAGWDFSWTFPGPFPPGYEPELTLSLDAPAYMVPGISVSDITAVLKDQITFQTREPIAGIMWSATLSNPGSIGFKLAGVGDYSDSVSQDYSDIGDDFWGSEPTFEFDVSLGDVGKTITLSVESVPFVGHPVTAEASILVVAEPPEEEEELPEDCSELYEKIACEFTQSYSLLYATFTASADLDCVGNCWKNGEGECGDGRVYCTFMDWSPVVHELLVGTPGFSGRYWYVRRYNVVTGQYASAWSIFPSGNTGTINCDGTIESTRDTSGARGMGFARDGNYELHLFVRCGSGYVGDPPVYMKAMTCLDENCE